MAEAVPRFLIMTMKQIILFVLLLLAAVPVGVMAQSQQQVRVLEYNGKEQKTPLAGVGLTVQNAASAISDAQGRVTLQFRTLRAGDVVQVRRIDLSGYEVFNKEAVEQWTLSPQREFTLVLCRSSRLKELCDKYNAAASASYERQLRKDRAALDKLRSEGKLRQQQYDEQLAALEQQYNDQLDQLENYVERFARIDLSEISEEEQHIIELVQQGDIDQAIRLYEELDLLSRYQQQSQELQAVRSTREQLSGLAAEKALAADSLHHVLQQQISLYEQQGDSLKADSLRLQIQSLAQ